MADWLIPLLQVGGIGAVVAIALLIMGRWLLNQITAALNSYVAAYAQQSASIDARIANLEKLAQEQAHLTRTVERIKDEIAAQAKSRDNRWEFRKGLYRDLLTSISDIVSVLSKAQQLAISVPSDRLEKPDAELQKTIDSYRAELTSAATAFARAVNLAPLATADSVMPSLTPLTKGVPEFLTGQGKSAAAIQNLIDHFNAASRLRKNT